MEKQYFCGHCGSNETAETPTGNDGMLYVAEDFDCGSECYDPSIKLIKCNSCKLTTYISID